MGLTPPRRSGQLKSPFRIIKYLQQNFWTRVWPPLAPPKQNCAIGEVWLPLSFVVARNASLHVLQSWHMAQSPHGALQRLTHGSVKSAQTPSHAKKIHWNFFFATKSLTRGCMDFVGNWLQKILLKLSFKSAFHSWSPLWLVSMQLRVTQDNGRKERTMHDKV